MTFELTLLEERYHVKPRPSAPALTKTYECYKQNDYETRRNQLGEERFLLLRANEVGFVSKRRRLNHCSSITGPKGGKYITYHAIV